ncbi:MULTISPECIES: flagellar motor stator protein MotA [Cobetia]|uniref:Flagellar motor stator protein MotA n=1 Tax=Cobetia marina TaxID=28258 RepID=A0ABU9GA99_COBMA|nr:MULTISPECIES: flagellar motor stator protein MotA [Cobetia]AOM01343.1 flagellar motor stator protein MotA [Cobetia marina]AZV31271.1 flagellar motor stator protein MotA [Cobetia sp. ICG0124]MDH2373647.1 flagellar motor stator protein MotA [Cobetia sp. 3AK]MDI6003587.1 flagellar motor stator protein MotA [Cobetia pacifica]MDN2656031.1 flagellar motor stator protein MotA [Cobetia sp. 14N.309.X.WAT.E.A4]
MLLFIGYLVVIGSTLGGYLMVGGHLAVLMQPAELLIIFGSAVGAFLAGNNGKAIKATGKAFSRLKRTRGYNKSLYMEVISLLYLLLSKSRQQGMLAIEQDIDNPQESALFAEYPRVLSDPILMNFITDYLRLMVSGNMDPFELESLMEHEIETFKHETEIPVHSLSAVADGLPAFGIVAAVMGVVHALASADQGAAQLGVLIANAMVGTFLGILLAYGFVTPVANKIQHEVHEAVKMMQCIRVILMASLNGYAPQISVEFGRKALFTAERPSFNELEEHVRDIKNKGAG